jgi:hypothetical protein
MAPIQVSLTLCRPAGADESNRLLITFRIHDKNQALFDRSDGDEPVLLIGMGVIEDLQVVVSSAEQGARLLKGDAMLLPIRAVLGFIPDDPHGPTIVQGLSKSMT